jgi:outer membrane receptor protein involved in Fe transport
VTYTVTGGYVSVSTPAYSGIPQAQYFDPYKQVDLSSSYTLPWFGGTRLEGIQITFDAINLNNAKMFSYVGDPSSVVSVYYPGPTYLLGFRGKF